MAMEPYTLIEYAKAGNCEGLRLCLANIDVDTTSINGNTSLHIVCRKGYEDCAKLLVACGASVNMKNSYGLTALHFAVMANNYKIAAVLLKSGASTEIANDEGDLPIHIAAREGYWEVAKTLCEHSSPLDTFNSLGYGPIHLASTYGHTEVVRCLCLSDCDIEKPNSKGITADVMAIKHLHEKIGLLLNKMRIRQHREGLRNHLVSTGKQITKQSVKILGFEGVGKTTTVKSLISHYFLGLFSKSKLQNMGTATGTSQPLPASPVQENRLEMVQSARQTTKSECSDDQSTQGIELHQATILSSDFTVWDFSGSDVYHIIYDFFIGDPYSIYIIAFNLHDVTEVQYRQCSFWLTFLQQRLRESDVKNKIRPRLILVGTHADSSRMHKDNQGNYINPFAQEMRDRLSQEFPELLFYSKAILCDSHLPNSPGIMELKCAIADETWTSTENEFWKSTSFLISVIQLVERMRKEKGILPVISWDDFVLKIHAEVNMLAGPHHINLVAQQLETMGGIYHLKSDKVDAIILNINWFCHEIIGQLLSRESHARSRLTGCYTEDDFQSFFINSPAEKMLPLLEALELCIQCDIDGEIEYEFPCFNAIEELEGLWSADDDRYKFRKSCYGGFRLKAPFHFLKMAFPRIQIYLRRMKHFCNDSEDDLYQWLNGSKFCTGSIESLITLQHEEIEIKVRGPEEQKISCFSFLENIFRTIQQVLAKMLPNMVCERHTLSSEDLRRHAEQPFVWFPENIFSAMSSSLGFNSTIKNSFTGKDESLLQLICFGSEEVCSWITTGEQMPMEKLPIFSQRQIARLLESTNASNEDWSLLAAKLGLGSRIDYIEKKWRISKSYTLLDLWRKTENATVGKLVQSLLHIGRKDVANAVMRSVPLILIKASKYDDTQRIVTNLLPL